MVNQKKKQLTILKKINNELNTNYKKLDDKTWVEISENQKLSEEFITKYKNKVDWYYISFNQKLSEKFIEKHKNKVKWDTISKFQKLSENFIKKHRKKFKLKYIILYQKLSKKFIKKHNIKNYNLLNIIHNCGDNNRMIYITKDKPKIINIGCFSGTKKEAIKAIKEKYGNTKSGKIYINNVKKCFNDIKVIKLPPLSFH